VLDAGGNPVADNDTVVTASIEKDDAIRMEQIASLFADATGASVRDLEAFEANGTTYVLAARNFDGRTYSLRSALYRWDAAARAIVPVASVPSYGAEDWEHVQVGHDHFLFLANGFKEVSNVDDEPLGAYVTESKVFRFTGEALVEVDSFVTRGARSVQAFAVGDATFVAVANNFDGLTPPSPLRTKWTRRVPHPVLTGHVSSLTPQQASAPRSSRTSTRSTRVRQARAARCSQRCRPCGQRLPPRGSPSRTAPRDTSSSRRSSTAPRAPTWRPRCFTDTPAAPSLSGSP